MNLVLIGPSGAGKGTQIDKLITSFGLVHFCPGNLFREHIKKHTALGLIAQKYIGRGELVPDEVVEAMLEEWLWLTDPGQDIIFDGFPRTANQAVFLDKLFKEVGRRVDGVIYLEASEEVVIGRLMGRRVCGLCHDHYHEVSEPFTACPYNKCQGEHLHALEGEKPEVIAARLKVFHGTIKPLVQYYEANAKLITINAEHDIGQVHSAILSALDALKPRC